MRKWIWVLGAGLLMLGISITYWFYQIVFSANVKTKTATQFFYIPTGCSYEALTDLLTKEQLLIHSYSFNGLAPILNLDAHVKPGRYELHDGMSNLELIRMLRSGSQSPVDLVLLKYRTLNDLSKFISRKLECDSTELQQCFSDSLFLDSLGFNHQTIISIIIPNTYEFYWNTSAKQFLLRMKKEYNIKLQEQLAKAK